MSVRESALQVSKNVLFFWERALARQDYHVREQLEKGFYEYRALKKNKSRKSQDQISREKEFESSLP